MSFKNRFSIGSFKNWFSIVSVKNRFSIVWFKNLQKYGLIGRKIGIYEYIFTGQTSQKNNKQTKQKNLPSPANIGRIATCSSPHFHSLIVLMCEKELRKWQARGGGGGGDPLIQWNFMCPTLIRIKTLILYSNCNHYIPITSPHKVLISSNV